MKRYLLALFAFVASIAAMHADDYSTLGYKGKILKATIDGHAINFDNSGNVTGMVLPESDRMRTIYNITRTSSGFTGRCDDGFNVTITVKNGHISNVVYNNGDNWTLSYTYDSRGFLTKVVDSKTWYETVTEHHEGSANVDTQHYQTYNKRAQEAAKRGNVAEAQKYAKLASEAAKKANVNVNQSYNTQYKKKQSRTWTGTFTNYKTDEYGNWTSRTKTENNGDSYTETQKIEYHPDFLSQKKWENEVKPFGNLDKIESFYNDPNTVPAYKDIAKKEWNSKVMGELQNRYDNKSEYLVSYAGKTIMDETNRQKCLEMAREDFCKKAERERDFAKVRDFANMKSGNAVIFDNTLRNRLLKRSEELRADSVKYLMERANSSLASNDYASADKYAVNVLNIDPRNYSAAKLRSEAEYQLCLQKETAGSITEQDYVNFLNSNPGSSYTTTINDKRARYLADNFDKNTTAAEAYTVARLPMSADTKEYVNKKVHKVEKQVKHNYFVANRGSFIHGGAAANMAFGKGALDWGIGAGFRLGWNRSLLNAYVGYEIQNVRYVTMTTDENNKITDKIEDGGRLNALRLNIPMALRLNFIHEYEKDFFLSAGVVYNVAIKGEYCYPDNNYDPIWTKDKDLLNKGTFSPRIGVGYANRNFEAELYGIIETKGIYDEDYVDGIRQYYYLNDKIVDKQLNGKFRIGFTFRYLFGK